MNRQYWAGGGTRRPDWDHRTVLDDVVPVLRCPTCAQGLARAGSTLHCPAGHGFDIARQGYVNLLTGRGPSGAETPEMLAARAALHDAGHLAPISVAIVELVPERVGLALDVGAGTGHHLAAVLVARPGSAGVALDISKAAARHSARAHPAIGSVVADVWQRLPLADGCADVLLDVFAPRHGAEFDRVLQPAGTLIVVTPTARHLAELVAPLGLLTVDPAKAERVEESLHRWFEPSDRRACDYLLALSREETARLVAMGPSAWHTTGEGVAQRLATWAEPITVTMSVEVTAYRHAVTGRG
jgi:23S rRNA (guanine745-N1)-methyltransferase